MVRIVGRPEGFISFLLTSMGLGRPTEFEVTRRAVNFRTANLLGAVEIVSPTAQISTAMGGFAKPVQYLVLAAIALGFGSLLGLFDVLLPMLSPYRRVEAGAFLAMVVLLALGLFFAYRYFTQKTLTVRVSTTSGEAFGLSFKSSVIEGKTIGFEDSMAVVNIIRDIVLESNQPLPAPLPQQQLAA